MVTSPTTCSTAEEIVQPVGAEENMTTSAAAPTIGEEIVLSERYLVSLMFQEAASLTESIIWRLENEPVELGDYTLEEAYECAGVVLVQSWNFLERTSNMLEDLSVLFGSDTSVPFDVLLCGVCFQMQKYSSTVATFLEEFLSKWKFVDGQYYVAQRFETNGAHVNGRESRVMVNVDDYVKLVSIYIIKLHAELWNNIDLGLSWIEKAEIPEDQREEFVSTLQLMRMSQGSSSTQVSDSPMPVDGSGRTSISITETTKIKESPDAFKVQESSNRENTKQTTLRFYLQKVSYLEWFHSITLKYRNISLLTLKKSFLLCLLMFSCSYLLRKKESSIKRRFMRLAKFIKKALVDLWQLAFSYQVNPLAAVQPNQILPVASRGSY